MPEATTTSSNKPGVFTDFFGSVLGTIQETAKEVIPNWTKQQLIEQSEDQLESPTYDQTVAPPRVESIHETAQGVPVISAMQTTAFSLGGFRVTYMHIALGFAGLLAIGLFLKMRR